MLLGSNCHVSGTGFLISADVIRENGGWPYHLLTEDIEFSVSCALKGRRIGYCDKAVIYDEQPTAFRQSWDQRLRWSKGFYQVNANYSGDLVRGFCQKPSWKSWSCYDMFMTVAPGMLLTLVTIAFNLVVCLACWGQPSYIVREILSVSGSFLLSTVASFYLGLLLYGILTVLCEWDQIQIPTGKKVPLRLYLPALYVYLHPHLSGRSGKKGGVETHLPHRQPPVPGQGRLISNRSFPASTAVSLLVSRSQLFFIPLTFLPKKHQNLLLVC